MQSDGYEEKTSKSKSRSIKQVVKEPAKQETCFIIMPFGEWFDYYFETIYIPAIESAGLIPRRADDLYRPSAIVHDIWAITQQAKVILADLSGKNPNVFYELGLAHAVAKPAILVTESIDDIPFDLRALRVIVYDKNEPNWGGILREKIETAIKEILASPLEAVLPAFIKVKKSTPKKTVTQAEKELIALKQDMDLVKRELQSRTEETSSVSRPRISLSEAIDYASVWVRKGAPRGFIVRRLENRGLSSSIAQKIVDDLRASIRKEESETQLNLVTPETKEETNK